MFNSSGRWRAALTATAAFALLLPAGVAHAAPESAKINKAVLADGKTSSFLVRLKDQADLTTALKATSKPEKTREVYQAKVEFAASSQAGLQRMLTEQKVEFTPFWAVNALKVVGDADLARQIAKLPEVESIEPNVAVNPPPTFPATAHPKVNGVEWNLDRIGAPRVWNEFGTRGEGIVVGNIGLGVKFDHPALATQYRGRKADGSVDHNYSWGDVARICPSADPCDVRGGNDTRYTSVMVGEEGADTIGVAPGAKWIAASGCRFNPCDFASVLAAGEWMLAPTDLGGRNPRPDLAPDILTTNLIYSPSAGGEGFRALQKQLLDAWVTAGILPVLGSTSWLGYDFCATTSGLNRDDNSYTVGMFGPNNAISPYSGRGPGANGEVKPNITAPGATIRTAAADGGYSTVFGGDYGAAHVAGTVALLWSAAPSLRRDIAATRALLDRTAIDVNDTSCGGTAEKNNVWGEGRLDAYAAVRDAPREAVGGLTGKITSQDGTPLAKAVVTVSGAQTRTVVTDAGGNYELVRLAAGDHRVRVKKLGYRTATATANVPASSTVTRDVLLRPLPAHTVSGTVTIDGAPQKGAHVAVAGTLESVETDAAGRYRITLPRGEHELAVTSVPESCAGGRTVSIEVDADLAKDIALPRRTDSFGYSCAVGTEPYVAGTEVRPVGRQFIQLPFAFPFYGESHREIFITKDGYLTLDRTSRSNTNYPLPSYLSQVGAIYPFWEAGTSPDFSNPWLYTATLGTAPNRTFVLEWRNVAPMRDPESRLSYSVLLGEDGTIGFRYRGISNDLTAGSSATVGIEGKRDKAEALLFSYDRPVLTDGMSLTFTPQRHGLVSGTIVDAGDGRPLANATVKIGDEVTITAADGTFVKQILSDDHRITVSKENYGTVTREVDVEAGKRTTVDLALTTGR
ncbi:carboxypeptidase regulatory-like domain-containing protein [Sinosporangium siamense]|uniref:Peptidase S8 n=1 Tax=Sinosporangium siamense TaxID=1367973 RepID=A0A919RGW2_9ACTN|nr:carboxypeptidase regulatory-like domain-containing protein [Sinosporangium siamense]GII92159.1 peptidase S8 [Sinosporangium siamense]